MDAGDARHHHYHGIVMAGPRGADPGAPSPAESEPVAPLKIPEAPVSEQIRELAALLADLHAMLGIIDTYRGELLPGEAQSEFHSAWVEGSRQLHKLTSRVLSDAAQSHRPYAAAQLVGHPGTVKKSLWRRSWDEFRAFWNSEPRTDEIRQKARRAGAGALRITAQILESFPGAAPVLELISVAKELLEMRADRNY